MSDSYNLDLMSHADNYRRALLDKLMPYIAGCGTIAEFGAGCGTYAKELSGIWPAVYCVEPDRSLWRSYPGLKWLDTLNSLTRELDAIYTINVLEHIEDDTEAIRTIAAKLRPGGRLFVFVPAHMKLWTRMDSEVGHLRRYSLKELVEKAEVSGFSVDFCGYFDWLGYAATTLHKILDGGSPSSSQIRLFDRVFAWTNRLGLNFGKNLYLCARKR